MNTRLRETLHEPKRQPGKLMIAALVALAIGVARTAPRGEQSVTGERGTRH